MILITGLYFLRVVPYAVAFSLGAGGDLYGLTLTSIHWTTAALNYCVPK